LRAAIDLASSSLLTACSERPTSFHRITGEVMKTSHPPQFPCSRSASVIACHRRTTCAPPTPTRTLDWNRAAPDHALQQPMQPAFGGLSGERPLEKKVTVRPRRRCGKGLLGSTTAPSSSSAARPPPPAGQAGAAGGDRGQGRCAEDGARRRRST
jgi:hypothetical protein